MNQLIKTKYLYSFISIIIPIYYTRLLPIILYINTDFWLDTDEWYSSVYYETIEKLGY